jgi:hypothetical protein
MWFGSSYRSIDYDGADSTVVAGVNDSGRIAGMYKSADCPAGCGFIGVPRTGVPACNQVLSMSYSGGTLNLGATLTTATPTTWSKWLFIQNTFVPLWSINIPTVASPATVNVPIPNFPHVGNVIGVSTLSTASGGIICADVASVNTGS